MRGATSTLCIADWTRGRSPPGAGAGPHMPADHLDPVGPSLWPSKLRSRPLLIRNRTAMVRKARPTSSAAIAIVGRVQWDKRDTFEAKEAGTK